MASIARQSTRQLARCLGQSARISTLPRTLRLPKHVALPGSAAALRAYSSNDKGTPSRKTSKGRGDTKDDTEQASSGKNGDGKINPQSEKQEGDETQPPTPAAKSESSPSPNKIPTEGEDLPPLPPGWTRLTDEEAKLLERQLSNLPFFQKESIPQLIRDLRRIGLSPEVLEVVKRISAGSPKPLTDIPALLRYSWTAAKRMAEWDVDKIKRAEDENDQAAQDQAKQDPRQADEEGKEKDSSEEGKQESQGQQGAGSGDGRGPRRPFTQNQPPKGQGRTISFSTGDIINYVVLPGIGLFVWNMVFPSESSREITWQELRKNFLDKGLVEKMVVMDNRVRVDLNREETQAMYPDTVAANSNFHYYFSIGSTDAFERRLDEAQAELGIPPTERIPVSYAKQGLFTTLLVGFGPTLLLVGLLIWSMRRVGGGGGGASGVFGFGKSKAKMFNQETAVKVKFSDVAGMDEAKLEIMEFVSFLRAPEKFQRLGAKIPRGAILSGPPGTGKTLLAKATAGESQVPFFSVSGSEFVEMFVGVGASRVRDLFTTARKNAPCIIFIDEIDAVGRARGEGKRFGGNDEREATLNQILTEMDGFNTSEQVVVLAGTNRPDILDKALLRPGRFDRRIHIDRPTMKGRQEIFRVHLAKIVTNEDMDHLTGRLAALTPGFAGADIANAVNEAALIAARANAQTVELTHFEQAIERVVGGLERKSLVLSPEEKKTVAYHEAGHAICGWYFQYADPLLKVSIIPRGQGALGYAQYLPATDAYLMNVKQLMDRMAMTLGGRVSEELHFPTVTTGASDDFKKVTQMASAMVTQWGMSEKLGPLSFSMDENTIQKPFAESTAQEIDKEVKRIVDQAYKQCRDLLTSKKKEVGLVAEELLKKEVLSRDDMVRLLGKRQWAEKEEFSKYFDGTAGGGKSAPPPFPGETTEGPPPAGPQPAIFKGEEKR